MPGPLPKNPKTRARQNKKSTRATLDGSKRNPVPELPVSPDGVVWHPWTVEWWESVWASPMSPEWDESDVHNVRMMLLLFNQAMLAGSPHERVSAMAEFRQHRKDLGLSPMDRRRLEWSIESAEEAKDRGRKRSEGKKPTVKAGKSGEPVDPREVLRVVS